MYGLISNSALRLTCQCCCNFILKHLMSFHHNKHFNLFRRRNQWPSLGSSSWKWQQECETQGQSFYHWIFYIKRILYRRWLSRIFYSKWRGRPGSLFCCEIPLALSMISKHFIRRFKSYCGLMCLIAVYTTGMGKRYLERENKADVSSKTPQNPEETRVAVYTRSCSMN